MDGDGPTSWEKQPVSPQKQLEMYQGVPCLVQMSILDVFVVCRNVNYRHYILMTGLDFYMCWINLKLGEISNCSVQRGITKAALKNKNKWRDYFWWMLMRFAFDSKQWRRMIVWKRGLNVVWQHLHLQSRCHVWTHDTPEWIICNIVLLPHEPSGHH